MVMKSESFSGTTMQAWGVLSYCLRKAGRRETPACV